MPAPATLRIREIFWSAQGEGLRAGISSIFIRLAGCSLRCPYCDTKDAWADPPPSPVDEIVMVVNQIRRTYPYSQVVITGGEPLEQDLAPLVESLAAAKYTLAIETNGLHFQNLKIGWWTVAPKDISGYLIHPELIRRISELKLIVNENLTPEVIKRLKMLPAAIPIILQPQAFDPDRFRRAFKLYETCQKMGLANIRLGIQMHTAYDIQ
jgi:7-carboxy-7-deazaguanine synthase